jgi:hypothetical protein
MAQVGSGPDKVTRLLLGPLSLGAEFVLTVEPVQVNGEPLGCVSSRICGSYGISTADRTPIVTR